MGVRNGEPVVTNEQLEDPFSPGFSDDPYPRYAALREAAPVYQHPLGLWMLTRYDDVSQLLRGPLSVEDRNVAEGPLTQLLSGSYYDEQYAARGLARGLALVDRDAPDHTRLRKLVSKAFTARAVQSLAARITEHVDGLLDEIMGAGEADLVQAFAFPLPFTVIAEMLGTPPSDHARIRELTGVVTRSLEPVPDPGAGAAISAANAELADIAADMIAWKREHPAEDLLSALIQAEDDGEVLNDEELITQALMLYIAGHETTVNLIAAGTVALLDCPDQFDLLRHDPDLASGAADELLRYVSPVQMSRRITLEPFTVGGITIPPGSFVLASLASANRDEHFWGQDAGQVRIARGNAGQHLSFGAGSHHCLGASLARLEGAIAFGRLAARLPSLALDGEVTWNGRMNLRGPEHIPVVVR
jgi:cytochrome P450